MSLHVKCQVVGPGECARTKAAKGQRWCQLQVVIVAMSRGWSLFWRHFIDEGGSVTCWGHQAFHLAFIWQLSRINGVSTSMTLLWPDQKWALRLTLRLCFDKESSSSQHIQGSHVITVHTMGFKQCNHKRPNASTSKNHYALLFEQKWWKNWQCFVKHCLSLFKGHYVNVDNVVLNCLKCNHCLKSQVSRISSFVVFCLCLCLCLYLCLCLCFCHFLFVGQMMSPHHSDQMYQMSQISRCCLRVFSKCLCI